jgi:hypothetical protein
LSVLACNCAIFRRRVSCSLSPPGCRPGHAAPSRRRPRDTRRPSWRSGRSRRSPWLPRQRDRLRLSWGCASAFGHAGRHPAGAPFCTLGRLVTHAVTRRGGRPSSAVLIPTPGIIDSPLGVPRRGSAVILWCLVMHEDRELGCLRV